MAKRIAAETCPGIAGNSNAGYSGDGGPATSAQLNDRFGVMVGSAGNIFIADSDNCLIREVRGSAERLQIFQKSPLTCQ